MCVSDAPRESVNSLREVFFCEEIFEIGDGQRRTDGDRRRSVGTERVYQLTPYTGGLGLPADAPGGLQTRSKGAC